MSVFYQIRNEPIQEVDTLPDFTSIKEFVCDLETTSGDPEHTSVNPWHHCSIYGLAIGPYEDNWCYYIPRERLTAEWIRDTFAPDARWINHNIKYDANVLRNEPEIGIHFQGKLFDTLTGAKLVFSDRFSYALDKLCETLKFGQKETGLLAPYLEKSKDYGSVPHDIMAKYACEDVRLTRRLAKFIEGSMPWKSKQVFETEQRLTSVLFDAEAKGLRISSKHELEVEQAKVLYEMLQVVAPKIEKIAGCEFEPHKNEDCEKVLVGKFKYGVLDYTDGGKPSFGMHVLKQYLAQPGGNKELIELCIRWRELWQFNNLYMEPYLELHKVENGGTELVLHPDFNQCVRTGRMSCRRPNMQQLNTRAKKLIIPRDGYSFLSVDYAQVEFRMIVHYLENRYAIEAYSEDPDTDFHTWVAEMVGIPRRPAKNVNFMLGYGGGKKKTLEMLKDQPDLMSEIRQEHTDDKAFKIACTVRAKQVYDAYHDALPELKRESKAAERTYRSQGYIHNIYGRRRSLPRVYHNGRETQKPNVKLAYKAFNNMCQSSAADLAKERAVALADHLEGTGAYLLAVVHDEFLLEVPNEVMTDSFVEGVVALLQTPSVELSVPIRCSVGKSSESWAKAK